MKHEIYGRGEYTPLNPEQIHFNECVARAMGRPFAPGWWLPDRVEDFRRSYLADAVAKAGVVYGSVYGGEVQSHKSLYLHESLDSFVGLRTDD